MAYEITKGYTKGVKDGLFVIKSHKNTAYFLNILTPVYAGRLEKSFQCLPTQYVAIQVFMFFTDRQ